MQRNISQVLSTKIISHRVMSRNRCFGMLLYFQISDYLSAILSSFLYLFPTISLLIICIKRAYCTFSKIYSWCGPYQFRWGNFALIDATTLSRRPEICVELEFASRSSRPLDAYDAVQLADGCTEIINNHSEYLSELNRVGPMSELRASFLVSDGLRYEEFHRKRSSRENKWTV